MKIESILKDNDISTYKKLNKMKQKPKKKEKKEKIELGDSVENLMKHDAYKRQGRRIKQTRWGK